MKTTEQLDSLVFARRLGPDPHLNGQQTAACNGCPDLWELENGDFAFIGIRITETAKAALPATAGCGPDEEIILVPAQHSPGSTG